MPCMPSHAPILAVPQGLIAELEKHKAALALRQMSPADKAATDRSAWVG